MSLLQTIRERAQGIMAWVLLIVVGVPFVLWGIQNYIDVGKEKPAIVVGDRELFDRDVTRAYERLLQEMGGSPDLDEKMLRQEAVEQLVNEEVIAQSAVTAGLAVSDQEVRELIQTMPYFQVEGKFDKEKYRNALASQQLSPAQFVARMKGGLISQQFQQGLLESAFTTPREVEALMRLKNQTRLVDYLELKIKPIARSYSEAELVAYQSAHADEFRTPERVAVDYLSIDLASLSQKVAVDESELHKLYEEQKSQFGTAERRKISHILIASSADGPPSDDGALKAKAEDIRAQLLQGEDFSVLAKTRSADPVSAKLGGDLGYLNPDAQDPAFTEAAEKLQLNEVSQPVKGPFGYHLIKLTQIIPASYKSYDLVRDELRLQAQKNKAEAEFYARGQRLAELTFEHADTLEVAASELGLKVEQTPLFTRDQGAGLAEEESVRKLAFSADVLEGKNSEPLEIGNERAVVLRLRAHEPATDRPLEAVRGEISAKLAAEEAKNALATLAEDLVSKARAGQSLADLAKAQGVPSVLKLPVQRTNETVPMPLLRAVFESDRPLPEKPVIGQVASSEGNRFIYSVLSISDGETVAKTPEEQSSAQQYMERGYGQLEFQGFIDRLRQQVTVDIRKQD